jgi:ribosome biogenesis protein Nip4
VFYVSEEIMKKAGNVGRDSIGTCIGKFTKTRKFRLHVTALDYLAPYAQVIVDNSPISTSRTLATSYLCLLFAGKDVAESVGRAAVPVRTQRDEVWVGEDL